MVVGDGGGLVNSDGSVGDGMLLVVVGGC
jgi:hypothetical protein